MIWFSIVVISIMTAFAIFGMIDLLFLKNKYGVGEEFKKGIELIGPLCLSIVGIISSVPLITFVIQNTISVVYEKIGLDPSLAVTSILAIDMGGFQIAMQVAKTELIGKWAGIVYGSMMGATIVFSIPVGLSAIKKKDIQPFAKGILFGISAIPFGAFIGGLMIGVPILTILINLIPPIIFSIIIIVCLILWPNGTTRVFKWFSVFVNIFGMTCLAIAMVKDLVLTQIANTGAFNLDDVPFINMFDPTSNGIGVAGAVGLVLSGALPFIVILNKALKKPLDKLTEKTKGTDYGISGFLLSAANNMAMFVNIEKMNEKEKVYNVAFSVCAAFVIGDHLAFTAANASDMILPMMVSKLVAGIIAVLFAYFYFKLSKNKEIINDKK